MLLTLMNDWVLMYELRPKGFTQSNWVVWYACHQSQVDSTSSYYRTTLLDRSHCFCISTILIIWLLFYYSGRAVPLHKYDWTYANSQRCKLLYVSEGACTIQEPSPKWNATIVNAMNPTFAFPTTRSQNVWLFFIARENCMTTVGTVTQSPE